MAGLKILNPRRSKQQNDKILNENLNNIRNRLNYIAIQEAAPRPRADATLTYTLAK